MTREEHDVPEWFIEYLQWLATKPRTIVESWLELEGAGDYRGDADYDYLEISWDRKEVKTMPFTTSSPRKV